MLVYVVMYNFVDVDVGSFDTDIIGVFSSIEEAKETFLNEMKTQKEVFFNDYDTEEENYVDGDMSWSIWEKDEYAVHHFDLFIKEQVVIE